MSPSATWRPERRPVRRVSGLVVAAFVVLGSVGCASSGGDEGAQAAASDQRAIDAANDVDAGSGAGLCLPPECGTTVPYLPGEGYVGPTPDAGEATIAVDGASVVAASSGDWWAQGLVVNGPNDLEAFPVVEAELIGSDGNPLKVVTTTALVAPLRAGEPAPFRVEAPGVAAGDVVDVRWRVQPATDGNGDSRARTLQIDVLWNRPAGGEPVSVPAYVDGGGPGTPLVTYLSVTNTGAAPVLSPRVIAAWVDGRGRVLGLASVAVPRPGTDLPLDELGAGTQADAALTLAPPSADGLAGVPPLLWGVSGT